MSFFRFRISFMFILIVCLTVTGLYTASDGQNDPGGYTFDPELYSGLSYRMIGPHRGGRVTAVAGHEKHPGTFYMGATGGGVWKTADYGKNWRNISDGFFEVGSIGSIDVADSDPNIIYVGTGSAAIRSNVSTGRGVYKSLDAGRTWQFMGLREAGQIGALVIHPENPDIVYLAALGHPFGPNPDRGVFRTLDGGENWEKVLFISDQTGAIDLSMNPQNPEEIFAAMWRGERKPWTIISGSTDGGLFRTRDGGENWEKLTAGLPEGLVGKSSVSVSPADPQRVYALIEAPDERGGVYRSDDGGESFAFVNGQKSLLYRPFYYTYIDTHPKDADTVYVNNEGFFRSGDGGDTFQRLGTPHGDNHGMWINPENPDVFIQSNDGGANVTIDGGKTWSTQYNQPTAEMYHVVVDNRFPYWVYGEQQDNSTIRIPSLPPISGRVISPIQFWEVTAGCETGPLAVHPLNPDIVYGGCKGRFSRYNHATGQEQQYWVYPHFNYGHAAREMPFRFQRTSPIEISPHNPEVIYHASHVVHKTTDEGRHWEIISPDLTANEPDKQGYSGEPITRDITGEEIYSAVYALRESLLEEGVIWAGSNDGLIHITRDGGKNWMDITPPDLPPGGRVQTIEPSSFIPGRALVAVYRYMLDDWAPYIYKTEDYGAAWTLLTDGTNGIPADHPARVIREDPDRMGLLYAGTEFGMFISFDDGGTWQSLQLNLPAVPVTDIKVHRKDLVLSTMGRSFWILDDISPLHQLTEEAAEAGKFLFKPRTSYRMRRSGYWGGQGVPEYPPQGVLIYYHLAQKPEQELVLKIADEQGNVIRNFSSRAEGPNRLPDDAGMHRFSWDLRYPGPVDLETGGRGGRGPLALPGRYQVRMSSGDWSRAQTFQLKLDPRVTDDGVTQADLKAQLAFNLRIRETTSRVNLVIRDLRQWRESLEEKSEDAGRDAILSRLNEIENQLIQTQEGKVGAQLKPKLVRQLQYLAGMTRQADQRPGEDAYLRLDDIEKELQQLIGSLMTLKESWKPDL